MEDYNGKYANFFATCFDAALMVLLAGKIYIRLKSVPST